MNQILRSCKFDIYLLSRCYGNQSKQRTYYDTLQIPQTSTQKEIREAFIKLSKEMHPDIKGQESHSEYVKVNEAYNILSKEHLRRVYDMNIKYGDSSYSSYSSNPAYEVRRRPSGYEYYQQSSNYTANQWEEHVNSQASNNYYGIKGIKRMKSIWIVFMCVSFASIALLIQIISMNRTIAFNREIIRTRGNQYQREYQQAQMAAAAKSREEQLQEFESKLQKKESSTAVDVIN